MMTLTTDQLAYVRSWVGQTETDDSLNERYDRLYVDEEDAAVEATIQESLRAQLQAMMLDQPGSMTIDDISLSYNTNIQYLREQLKKFESESGLGGSGSGALYQLVRPPRR